MCLAVGRRVLGLAGLELVRPLEVLLFGTLVGSGVVATAVLLLGALGVLGLASLAALFLLLALAVRRELLSAPGLVGEALAYVVRRLRERPPLSLALAALALVATVALLLALAPPADWDSLMYHLTVPRHFLSEGRIAAPADSLHVVLVGLAHALYVPLLAVGSTPGPAILGALLALLLALAAFSLADRLLGVTAGALGLVAVWGTTTILLVAVTARVDVTLALFLFAGHYALLVSLHEPGERRFFYLAAVLLGLAFGVKYNALLYVAALAPLAVWAAVRQERATRAEPGTAGAEPAAAEERSPDGGSMRWRGLLRRLAGFGGLGIAVALPWLVKDWILLGGPATPLTANTLLEPWLAALLGSRTIPEPPDAEIFRFVWEARLPFNLRDAFFAPGRLSIEAEAVFYFTSPALLLAPLGLLWVRERAVAALLLPAAAYVALLVLVIPEANLRYLIPATVPLTLVVAHVAVRATARLDSAGQGAALLRRAVLLGLAALACWHTGRAAHFYLTRSPAAAHVAGIASPAAYLDGYPKLGPYAETVAEVNRTLGPEDRLLMLFEARGFYFAPPVLQDNRSSNWFFLYQALGDERCLGRETATHVLVGVGAANYYLRGGADPELLKWEALQRFAARCLVPVFERPAFALFEVR